MGAKDERRRGRPLADQRSLGKETGREGKGRMKKKKKEPTFWLLGIRVSQSSRQSHAQKVTLHHKGAQRVFAGAGLAV